METNKILQANILDLLFDGRNKDYGAYKLRKNYNKRVISSLLIVMACIACFIAYNIIHANSKKENSKINEKSFILTNVHTKPIVLKKEQPKAKAKQKTLFKKVNKNPAKLEVQRHTPPKIVPDIAYDASKSVKKIDDLANKKIANFEQKGITGNIVGPTIKVDGIGGDGLGSPNPSENGGNNNGKGNGDGSNEGMAVNVQSEAKYPDGIAGWKRFLERSLQSSIPAENGAPVGSSITVIVSFTVDVDGSISNVVADNDPGYGTAQEAVKAIKRSGKWIPAMQNGRRVKYRQKQRITFQVTDE